jgi:hypothetical protein
LIVLVVFTIFTLRTYAHAHDRYLLLNLHPADINDATFRTIAALADNRALNAPRLGVGAIISYLRHPPEHSRRQLDRLLALCDRHNLAVIVQLDGEQYWNARPDLWNWWDPSRPGYDPANAANVEWSGWGPEHALKLAWRNWGRQHRVLPPPNFMSERYRAAWRADMRPLVEQVVRWRDSLPADRRWLLVGVKVGWESAIGVGSHYFPAGNRLADADPALDPRQDIDANILPGRGFQPIGYAAVATAGLAASGDLREEHLAEVVRRHLADLSREARQGGLPREQIFTHCGGWKEGELLYRSALNDDSCPGWSFYRHARDPHGDKTAMAALAASDAPYWGAVEWLPVGAKTAHDWRAAARATLAAERCRYLCLYNWRTVAKNSEAVFGLGAALRSPLVQSTKSIND